VSCLFNSKEEVRKLSVSVFAFLPLSPHCDFIKEIVFPVVIDLPRLCRPTSKEMHTVLVKAAFENHHI
jgi:hypothetical protein